METWEELTARIQTCSLCETSCDCKRKIIGSKDNTAPVMFVGERPSNGDLLSGKAFSGKAGKYLRKLMHKAGYRKGDVYLTYAIKCRYAGETPPKDAFGNCALHLLKQVDCIKPRLIVALGSVAFNALCPNIKRELGGVRGDKIPSLGYTVMPIWHPGFVLSSFSALREQELYKDLKRSYRYAFFGSSEK